jgi:hypothetical protein
MIQKLWQIETKLGIRPQDNACSDRTLAIVQEHADGDDDD